MELSPKTESQEDKRKTIESIVFEGITEGQRKKINISLLTKYGSKLIYNLHRRHELLEKLTNKEKEKIEMKSNFYVILSKFYKRVFDAYDFEYRNMKEGGEKEKTISEKVSANIRPVNRKIFNYLNGAIDKDKKPSTSSFTTLYGSAIKLLSDMPSYEDVKNISRSEFIKRIQSMYNNLGIPTKEILPILKNLADTCEKYSISFSSISGMFNGRGAPTEMDTIQIERIITFIQGKNIDFSSISSMFAGRGIPIDTEFDLLKELISYCEEKKYLFTVFSKKQNGIPPKDTWEYIYGKYLEKN